jgi:glycosyltransferase involved in cell wall biosynthesis
MASIEIVVHNIMGIHKLVNNFIAPSEFLRNKFIEFGFNVKNFESVYTISDVHRDDAEGNEGDYVLYVGRLSEEKGVKTIIDAVGKVDSCRLKIVGDGPLKDELVLYAESKTGSDRIEFLGHKNRMEVNELLRNCKFLVIPSEWYEVTGLVILEAYAYGKPVIGSRIGGIPEFILENETGLLFEMGNAEDLSSKINYMIHNPDEIVRMGRNARNFVESRLNAEIHYKELMKVYENTNK